MCVSTKRERWIQWPQVVSMTGTVHFFLRCSLNVSARTILPYGTFELYTFFRWLNFNHLEVTLPRCQNWRIFSGRKSGWKLWFPMISMLYFGYIPRQPARRPSQKNPDDYGRESTQCPAQRCASRPPRAAAKMPSGCFSLGVGRQWNWRFSLVKGCRVRGENMCTTFIDILYRCRW